MRLKLLVGLSGNEYSLAPGEEHDFDGELVDGKVTGEAGRLIDAGIAELAETGEPEPVAPVQRKKAKPNVVSPKGNDASD